MEDDKRLEGLPLWVAIGHCEGDGGNFLLDGCTFECSYGGPLNIYRAL